MSGNWTAEANYVGTGLVLCQSDGRLVFAVSKTASWEIRHGKLGIAFEGVGGRLEAGETPVDCAKREAREEASCDIELRSAQRTYLQTAAGKLAVITVDSKPTPLALYEKSFAHPTNQPELLRSSTLRIVIYLAECLGDPRPSAEIPALLVMTAQQYLQAVRETPLSRLLAAGAELIEVQHVPRDAIMFPGLGTAEMLARVLEAEGEQEVLTLFSGFGP